MPSIYEKYNLKQVINTSGRMTILGVSTPRQEVIDAVDYGLNHYFEIKDLMRKNNFDWIQGSTYLTQSDDLGNLFRAIEALKKIEWFRKSVRDIRGYKVENWSDFTSIIKEQ